MSIIEGLLIFFAIILIYFILVKYLSKKGILEKYNISFYGPALLLRTNKGKKFLTKIGSKKRFWKAFGSFSVIFCFLAMLVMVFILILQAWAVMGFTAEEKELLPGPEFVLVLPGINPILPLEYLGYIILALVVAIIVHEFSHGIMAIAGDIKVKSLGILYFIVPVGAFCEPDEEELKKVRTTKRMRVYGAGPLANFVVVLISIIILSFVLMPAVEPAAEGITIVSIDEDSPAGINDFKPGMIIKTINDTAVESFDDYFNLINDLKANQSIEISYYWYGHKSKTVVLSDKYEEYEKRDITNNNISNMGKGYFGIYPINSEGFLPVLKNPFGSIDHLLIFYILPLWGYFQGYNPIVAPFTESYVINGPLGVLPANVFWVIVNALYWILWLNLAVGLFNVLPMIPLDGGFLFNDAVGSFIKKIKKDITDEKKDKIVKNVSLIISLLILLAIIFPFLIKYI